MILHLSGEINYKMFDDLIKAGNLLKPEEILQIYFTCSEGGFSDVAIAMVDYINRDSKIEIAFYGELFSAGMVIFLAVNCNKIVLKDTRGMYHFSWQEMNISETGKPSSECDIFSMKEMKKSKERSIAFLKKTKLSEYEIAKIKRGKDVYFSYERMLELI